MISSVAIEPLVEKSFPVLKRITLSKLRNIYKNIKLKDAHDQFFYSAIYRNEKNVDFSYLAQCIVCPYCNTLPFCLNNKLKFNNHTLIKCENCKKFFYKRWKKVKEIKCISQDSKKKKKKSACICLNKILANSNQSGIKLDEKLHSYLIDSKVIVPPPMYCTFNKQLNSLLKNKVEDVQTCMPLLNNETKLNSFIFGNIKKRINGGKNNFCRKYILSRRFIDTGRTVIVPEPQLLPNEVMLPEKVGVELGWPQYVLLVRFPSLDLQNVTFHKVIDYVKDSAMRIPITITKRHHADFDGDEMQIISLNEIETIAECMTILNPEENIASMQNLKISVGQDASATCNGLYNIPLKELENDLYELYAVHGSKYTFDKFCQVYNKLTKVTWNTYGCSLSCSHLLEMLKNFPDDINSFEEKLKNIDWSFTWFNSIGFEAAHIYQLVKNLGIQNNQNVSSNFLQGLTRDDFFLHCQTSREAIMDSKFCISVDGYNYYKLSFCTKDLVVHYDGSVCTVSKTNPKVVSRKVIHLLPTLFPETLYHKLIDKLLKQFENMKKA